MSFAATLHCDARSSERYPVELDGTVRDTDWRPIDVGVLDLSMDGFRIAAPGTLAEGMRISLGLPGLGARRATVVRTTASEHGCRFDEPLTPDQLAATRAAVATAPIPFPASSREALLLQTALPPVDRFSARTRLAMLAGGTAASWGMIVSLRALVG